MTRLESFVPDTSLAFPCLPPDQVMTILDLEDLMETAPPKGETIAALPAKHWLPCNEQLAVQLGHAQQALRLLDDQRALVTAVQIHADLILIDLARAPAPHKAQWPHVDTEKGRVMITADLTGADQSVLLRWPLES